MQYNKGNTMLYYDGDFSTYATSLAHDGIFHYYDIA